jgi:hypothetical protein
LNSCNFKTVIFILANNQLGPHRIQPKRYFDHIACIELLQLPQILVLLNRARRPAILYILRHYSHVLLHHNYWDYSNFKKRRKHQSSLRFFELRIDVKNLLRKLINNKDRAWQLYNEVKILNDLVVHDLNLTSK